MRRLLLLLCCTVILIPSTFAIQNEYRSMRHWLPSSLCRRTSLKSIQGLYQRNYSTSLPVKMSNTDSATSIDDDFSFRRLQSRMAHYLEENHPQHPANLSVAIAGGGGTFLSTLAATPGASSLLAEGTITYSRESFADYTIDETASATSNPPQQGEPVQQYASRAAADRLAKAACARSRRLVDQRKSMDQNAVVGETSTLVGLSCTSVLRSLDHRPRGGSRAFLSASTGITNRQIHLGAKLSPDTNRTRYEEDLFLAHCLLSMLEFASGAKDCLQVDGVQFHKRDVGKQPLSNTSLIYGITKANDKLEVELEVPNAVEDTALDSLHRAADIVLSGNADAVMLVPTAGSASASFEVLESVHLPANSLIVPGSFNPPHVGHTALAVASADAMEQTCDIILFELSITNVDKPSLAAEDVAARLQQFLALRNDLSPYYRWGILLTDASLFQRKADILQPLRQDDTARGSLTFCIGTDTLVRILDPKYYGNSDEVMLTALRNMQCRFVVGGRLEQKKNNGDFVKGAEEIRNLPADVRALFTILPDFRVDLSSSELRAQGHSI